MNSIVENLERQLLPRFQELAEHLSAQFPHVRVNVCSISVGALTEYQGHHILIDCLLTDAPANQPDNVSLSVDLRHLTSSPKVDADVCWGHPSGHVEAEFSFGPLEISDKVLGELYADLPRLNESLTEAIRRGKPSNWDGEHT